MPAGAHVTGAVTSWRVKKYLRIVDKIRSYVFAQL